MSAAAKSDPEFLSSTSALQHDSQPSSAPSESPLPPVVQLLISALPRLLLVPFIVVLFLWIYNAEGGLGTVEENVFGVHALLMSLMVVVLMQEAVLVFSPAGLGAFIKNVVAKRMVHVGLHILSLAAAIGGLVAIIAYKNLSDQPPAFPFFHLYSPHSWAGIAFLALYIIQFIGGAASQATILPARTHRVTRRLHALLGDACYILGVAVCAMGFQDMQGSDLAESSPPMDMTNMTMNMTGYYPDSNLARYASANTLLLIVIAIAVYVAKTKF